MKRIYGKRWVLVLVSVFVFGYGAGNTLAQDTVSVLYVPLIGITSVPDPLSLPAGPGQVIYHYAVKNFLQEVPLTDIHVSDDSCGPVAYVEGDDNGDVLLDYSETWRYTCTTRVSATTNSTATATGTTDSLTAVHSAYSTVVVGSGMPAPLISIINITKVSYPLSLPVGGGDLTYTYRVTNPGVMPLSDVTVTDNSCPSMSGKLGDVNGNSLLDINEAWTYTCAMRIMQTTTSTATARAFSNGKAATAYATMNVTVAIPEFPNTGSNTDVKIIIWEILSGILAALIAYYFVTRKARVKSYHE